MKTEARQLARGLFVEIQARGAEETDAVTEAFVAYLSLRHELSRWREVVRALDGVWKEKFGVGNVEVTSARELSKELQASIGEAFQGASVTTRVLEQTIGGMSIRIDDRIIDATIRARLESLKFQLTKGVGSRE